MGYEFVFDANVPICLDKIRFFKETLDCMEDLGDSIYINSLNFYEIHEIRIRRKIEESPIFKVIDYDENSYEDFKEKKLKPARIRPNREDGAILHTSLLVAADHLVSNDFGVIDIAERLKKASDINYMVPFTVVGLLKYLHLSEKITYLTFLKQSLRLFRNHEIENLFRGIQSQHWTELEVKNRFQSYSSPIIENYEQVEGVYHG